MTENNQISVLATVATAFPSALLGCANNATQAIAIGFFVVACVAFAVVPMLSKA